MLFICCPRQNDTASAIFQPDEEMVVVIPLLSPSSATKSFVPVGSLWSLEDEWSLRMVDRQQTFGLSKYVFLNTLLLL